MRSQFRNPVGCGCAVLLITLGCVGQPTSDGESRGRPEVTDAHISDAQVPDADQIPDAALSDSAHSPDATASDAATPDATAGDASPSDAAVLDSASGDAAVTDASLLPDAAELDSGARSDAGPSLDAAITDATGHVDAHQPPDSGGQDAATPDAATTDAAMTDSATTDATPANDAASGPDAGAPDSAGSMDSGSPADATVLDAATGQDAGEVDSGPEPPLQAIRIMAGNISSGNFQSYDPGHGIRIFQGLTPDIAVIQELNYMSNSASDIRAFVDTAFGPEFHFQREDGAQIPNGVVSRWPIIAGGVWEDTRSNNREFVWARVDIPGSVNLVAVSVHLLTSSATTRDGEAAELVQYVQANVLPSEYLVIGGDLNTANFTEAALTTFSLIVDTTTQAVDGDGNPGTNAGRTKPYDWLMPDPDLHAHQVPVVIGTHAFVDGLVFDSRVYTPLSDVAPVLVNDSGAPSMQHMAIVRDFLVPAL